MAWSDAARAAALETRRAHAKMHAAGKPMTATHGASRKQYAGLLKQGRKEYHMNVAGSKIPGLAIHTQNDLARSHAYSRAVEMRRAKYRSKK